ncbi:MAG: hypothetical protein KDN18_07935 [Verrucomicrobiae bacterium]|nr:hypothetical protein [Verrucomicrobiae bacterium]
MSSFVKHQAPAKTSVKLAILLGIVWAALLAGIWFSFRGGAEQGGFLHFIARFHVLIVHLPIGLIFLAVVMEFLGYFTAFSHLRPAMPFVLWLSFLSGVGATVVGYLLMTLEDFSGRAMDLHLYFGLAVVVLTLIALVASVKGKRVLTGIGAFAAAFATAASGHFGGAMVHEPKYLTEYAPEAFKPALLIGLGHSAEEAKPEGGNGEPAAPEVPIGERLVYEDFIVPILDKTCNECHNENKIKGKLRMDTHELLLAGAEGSDYTTVVPGKADDSEMIVRVLLPEDDDEFMPPQGEPLKPAEVELLKLWINAGAKTETTVAELGSDPAVAATVAEVAAIHSGKADDSDEGGGVTSVPSIWDSLPEEERTARLAEVNEAAEKYHFSLMPVSAEDERLRVNVINAAKDFGDDQLKMLEPVAERIVWLDLARSQVTDEGMKTVRLMRDLERLHLENTAITDKGIAELASLAKLEYLNLYGTKVGNGIFETFAKLPNLRKVYVWQTAVDPAQAKAFERSVNLEVNTGVELSQPPPQPAPQEIKAPPAEKPAETKPAEKKPEPAKADAPKPAEKKPELPKADTPKPAAAPKPAATPPAPSPKPADPVKATAPAAPKAAAPQPSTPEKPATPKPAAPAPEKK